MADKGPFYDELLFDNRDASKLFFGEQSSAEPLYADLLKRWVTGNEISGKEQKIVVSILIYHPEYVLFYGKSSEFIGLLYNASDQPEFQNPLNPERGLILYARFYFLIETGLAMEALTLINELNLVLNQYGNAGIRIIKYPDYLPNQNNGFLYEAQKKPHAPDLITTAYIKIITLILNSKELFTVESGINYDNFPLPRKDFSDDQCINLRSVALSHYTSKKYKKAIELYNYLRIFRFQIPGTLIHIARIEIMLENYQQSKILTEISWLHRPQAAPYVVARILWFKLLFCFLEETGKKDIQEIIIQLKIVLNSKDAIMDWTMQPVIDHVKPLLTEQQHSLLIALVNAMSDKNKFIKLDDFGEWTEANSEDPIQGIEPEEKK